MLADKSEKSRSRKVRTTLKADAPPKPLSPASITPVVQSASAARNGRRILAKELFVATLAAGGTISQAADAADIGKSSAYEWRADDPAFAAAWDAAFETGTDRLEEVARTRAIDGSDTLMIFLLKSRRPKIYRENIKVESDVNLTSAPGASKADQALFDHANAFAALKADIGEMQRHLTENNLGHLFKKQEAHASQSEPTPAPTTH